VQNPAVVYGCAAELGIAAAIVAAAATAAAVATADLERDYGGRVKTAYSLLRHDVATDARHLQVRRHDAAIVTGGEQLHNMSAAAQARE